MASQYTVHSKCVSIYTDCTVQYLNVRILLPQSFKVLTGSSQWLEVNLLSTHPLAHFFHTFTELMCFLQAIITFVLTAHSTHELKSCNIEPENLADTIIWHLVTQSTIRLIQLYSNLIYFLPPNFYIITLWYIGLQISVSHIIAEPNKTSSLCNCAQ